MNIHFSNAILSYRETEYNGRTFHNYSITVGDGRDKDIFCKNVYLKKNLNLDDVFGKPRDFDVNMYSKWNEEKKQWSVFYQVLN